ncbi:MAG: hypothetical protein ABI583_05360 [Betaproteobacteria bacterium]
MKRLIFLCLLFFSTAAFVGNGDAQVLGVTPANPTAADSVVLVYRTRLFGVLFLRDSYRVSMSSNRIRVTMGELDTSATIDPGLTFDLQFDVGRLPAGSYLIDLYQARAGQPDALIQSDVPLTVTDNRIAKATPYVRLNYSDHWWNPAESGWGLFIWHDNRDRLLAAWFTYGADNRAEWYTIQAGQWTRSVQYEGQIIKTTGPVFSSFVPGSNVQAQVVGTATLIFTDVNNGTFTYTLNGVTQTKPITRFKQ